MLRTMLKTTTAAALIATLSSSAFAADANAVFAGLAAQMARQGVTLKADSVTEESGGIVLSGISIGGGGSGPAPITLEKILLAGVEDGPNGGFSIETMAIPAFQTSKDGIDFKFGGAQVQGLFIAGPDEKDPILKGNYYRKLITGPLEIGPSGRTAFSFSGSEMNLSPYAADATLNYDLKMSDMVLDLTLARDAKFRDAAASLGYSQLKGEVTGAGSWDPESGLATLKPLKIATADAADLSFEMEIGGYTPELMAAMQEMQTTMKGNEQAMGIAMFGLMQQLDVRQLAITLDDNSLTGRLLDFFGAQQGMNRESTVAFAKGMVPLGLAQLGNPDFAAKASAAIGQYLGDPKNLRIEAAPTTPVPMASIMAGASTNPASLLDTLAVKVTANQ